MTANTIDQIVRIERATDARTVGLDAYRSLIALLETLDESDWRRPTECPPWTVADLAGHLIGAAKGYAGLGELFRQQLYGVRHRGAHGGNALDATNSLQVAEHAHLGNDERIAALHQLAESAIDGRLRMPADRDGWRHGPAATARRAIGQRWLRGRRHAAAGQPGTAP